MCRPNLKDKKGAVASQRSGLWRPSIWLFESSILPNRHIFKVKRFCKCDIIVQAHVGQIVHILVAYFIPAFVSLVHAWLANSMLDSWPRSGVVHRHSHIPESSGKTTANYTSSWKQRKLLGQFSTALNPLRLNMAPVFAWARSVISWSKALRPAMKYSCSKRGAILAMSNSLFSKIYSWGCRWLYTFSAEENILRRSMINGHCGSHVELLNLTVFTRNTKEPCPFNLAAKQISTKVLV